MEIQRTQYSTQVLLKLENTCKVEKLYLKVGGKQDTLNEGSNQGEVKGLMKWYCSLYTRS